MPPLSGDFCADIRTLDALDEDDRLDMGSSRSEAFALVEAYFAGLRAEAPPELRASIDRLLAVVTELVDLPDDDPESLGKAFALLFAPDVLAEAKKLNDYSRDVCGLAEEVFPPGGIGPDDGAKGDEDGEPSLMEKVEMANEDASWWEHKRGHSMLTSFREAQVSIFGDFDELEALAACEAVVAAASTDYSTLKVTITEADTTTVLVTRDASTGDTCRAT